MRSKTNTVLLISAALLFLILGLEIYYLFFYHPLPTNYQVNENRATQTTGGLSGLWKESTPKVTNKRFAFITQRNELIKPLFQTGVLKSYSGVETYKTIITAIGPKNTSIKADDGSELRVAYEIRFSTQAKTGEKELTLVLSPKELLNVAAYKAVGDERVPIDIKEIKAGDFVGITLTIDYFADPDNGFSSIEIEKLL